MIRDYERTSCNNPTRSATLPYRCPFQVKSRSLARLHRLSWPNTAAATTILTLISALFLHHPSLVQRMSVLILNPATFDDHSTLSPPSKCQSQPYSHNEEQILLARANQLAQIFMAKDKQLLHALPLVAPGFQAEHESSESTMCLHEFIDLHKYFLELYSECRLEVLSHWVDVHDNRLATVWLFVRFHEAGGRIRRDGLDLSRWEKRGGSWQCYRYGTYQGQSMVAESFALEGSDCRTTS